MIGDPYLDDPGGEALPVTERGEVEDLVRSELSDGQSDWLLSALGRDDYSDSSPTASCHRASTGIHQETDQEVCLDGCILSAVFTRRPHAAHCYCAPLLYVLFCNCYHCYCYEMAGLGFNKVAVILLFSNKYPTFYLISNATYIAFCNNKNNASSRVNQN